MSPPFRRAPHNIEAEQALLGAILLDNRTYDCVSEILSPADFFDPVHASIYEMAAKLIGSGKQATPITLRTFFETAEPITPDMTVPQYLGRLMAGTSVTLATASDYARVIYELARRRAIIIAFGEIVDAAYDTTDAVAPDALIAAGESSFEAMRSTRAGHDTSGDLIYAPEAAIESVAPEVIEGMLSGASVAVLHGPSQAGKTFYAIHMLGSVARGDSFLGRQTQTGATLYVPLEGAGSFAARIVAYRTTSGDPGRAFAYTTFTGRLTSAPDAAAFVSRIIAAGRSVSHVSGLPLKLVAIDTLAVALAGENENDAGVMGQAVRHAQRIVAATGATVLLLHHPGKDAQKGMRGSYALFANVDAVIRIDREEGAVTRTVYQEKMRDGSEGPRGAFTLDVLTVGSRPDGRPIMSCVVRATDQPTTIANQRARLPAAAVIALDALRYAMTEVGQAPPQSPHIPPGIHRVVLVETWRAYAYRKGISSSEEPRAKQQAFKRGSEVLVAARRVAIWDVYAWMID